MDKRGEIQFSFFFEHGCSEKTMAFEQLRQWALSPTGNVNFKKIKLCFAVAFFLKLPLTIRFQVIDGL